MASFKTTGIEGLELSLAELAALPEEVLQQMLDAGGEVVKAAQVRRVGTDLSKSGDRDTGQLKESIQINRKLRKKKDERYITVYPAGVRRAGKNGTPVRNAEVGFVQEFGAPHRKIQATQWMRAANEEAADGTVDAEAGVYDEWLKSKGL